MSFREEEAVLHVTSSRCNTSISHDPVHATRFGTGHTYQAKESKVMEELGQEFSNCWDQLPRELDNKCANASSRCREEER